jgi:hypothetical protein
MSEPFKSWAIVEVMGHNEYAGMVTEETIGGAAMIRVDVPAIPAVDGTPGIDGFTKYLSSNAIYGISPCTEATARARAVSNRSVPFDSWSVEKQVVAELRAAGKLVEAKQLPAPKPRPRRRRDDDE